MRDYAHIIIFQIVAFAKRYAMLRLFRNKKGLSAVVTTLIILVTSVLLASSVTYYATNISASRVQEESVYIRQAHLWVNSTGSTGAMVIKNAGGRDAVVDSISIGGKQIAWTDVYLWRASDAGVTDIANNLNVTKATIGTTASTVSITVQGSARTFSQQTGKFTVRSAETIVVYLDTPGALSISDISRSASMTVNTAQNSYAQETNIKSAT